MGQLSGWGKRTKITIDGDQFTANATNFTIPIYLSASCGQLDQDLTRVFDEVGADYQKIAITDSDGFTELHVEVAYWDAGSEVAVLYVNVYSVESGVDYFLYIYYDSTHTDNTTYIHDSPYDVYDTNYVAVYHLNESGSGSADEYKDSSGHSNHAVGESGACPTRVGGLSGYAQQFDGANDRINLDDSSDFDFGSSAPFTIEAVIKSTEDYGTILSFRHSVDGGAVVDLCIGYCGVTRSAKNLVGLVRQNAGGGGYAQKVGGAVANGSWHHVSMTRNAGNQIELFLDGVSQGTAAGTQSGGSITTNLSGIGCEINWVLSSYGTADDRYLNGYVDEVRVSNSQRLVGWLKAVWEGANDNLNVFGSEEVFTSRRKRKIMMVL